MTQKNSNKINLWLSSMQSIIGSKLIHWELKIRCASDNLLCDNNGLDELSDLHLIPHRRQDAGQIYDLALTFTQPIINIGSPKVCTQYQIMVGKITLLHVPDRRQIIKSMGLDELSGVKKTIRKKKKYITFKNLRAILCKMKMLFEVTKFYNICFTKFLIIQF